MNWLEYIVKWTNDNSGFLSLLTFLVTLFLGWISGLFNSLIKKPKLKVRFIDKVKVASFFYTGRKHFEAGLNESFELHKTGFAVYMSIANIGNMKTAIDKVYLGYHRNAPKKSWFKSDVVWLAQWNSGEPFRVNFEQELGIELPSLRMKHRDDDYSDKDRIDVGDSIIGVAYFEQEEAWGNFNPKVNKDNTIDVIIKIRDVYDRIYKFKTQLSMIPLEKAQELNQYFGRLEDIINPKAPPTP